MNTGGRTVFGGPDDFLDVSVVSRNKQSTCTKGAYEIIGTTAGKHNTCRLYLEPLSTIDSDIRRYTTWINSKDVRDMLGRADRFVTVDEQREFVKHCEGKPYFNIVYSDGNNNKIIGVCNIVVLNDNARHGIIGIHIGDSDYRHKGLGKKALQLLITLAFESMNLESLSLSVMADNTDAIMCYKSVGFKQQGVMRKRAYYDGKYHDSIYMDIIREEYFSSNE
ncbi:MAG: GNAT family N-acetyltransferase [Lachnospiraceae bacterium]|nr:GNAT family N-acetyltransferase [Lachnospiraceae bacterium]